MAIIKKKQNTSVGGIAGRRTRRETDRLCPDKVAGEGMAKQK
jgi:hypothetical protein